VSPHTAILVLLVAASAAVLVTTGLQALRKRRRRPPARHAVPEPGPEPEAYVPDAYLDGLHLAARADGPSPAELTVFDGFPPAGPRPYLDTCGWAEVADMLPGSAREIELPPSWDPCVTRNPHTPEDPPQPPQRGEKP
jgi:hypothetical protein